MPHHVEPAYKGNVQASECRLSATMSSSRGLQSVQAQSWSQPADRSHAHVSCLPAPKLVHSAVQASQGGQHACR